MAKKQKEPSAPTPATPVVNRDALQRLNYLYQASVLISSALPAAAQARTPGQRRTKSTRKFVKDVHQQAREEDTPMSDAEKHVKEGQPAGAKKPPRQRRRAKDSLLPVSRHLAKEMVEVAKKATVRMDPAVKRTKCKGCGGVLVPGMTSRVRIKPSGPHGRLVVHTCTSCRSQRRLPASPHLCPEAPAASAEHAAQAPLAEAVASTAPLSKRTRREERERRQARQPPLFQREGHVTIRGNEVLAQDEYRQA
ncbi:hypothetical protein JCM11641_004352 [Rhodosporidiobolus odoratus]